MEVGRKDKAGKVVVPIEQAPTARLCLNEETCMSYMQWWDGCK